MTTAQIAARKKVGSLTLANVGRNLNSVAEGFLALCAGDEEEAKRSLLGMPLEPQLGAVLYLAVETVAQRRQRELDLDLSRWGVRCDHR